jgi:hypothetical protein
MLAVSIIWRSAPVKIETMPDRIVVHEQVIAPAMIPVLDSGQTAEYVRLRQAVLERGMDALPPWRPVTDSHGQVPLDRDHLEDLVSST